MADLVHTILTWYRHILETADHHVAIEFSLLVYGVVITILFVRTFSKLIKMFNVVTDKSDSWYIKVSELVHNTFGERKDFEHRVDLTLKDTQDDIRRIEKRMDDIHRALEMVPSNDKVVNPVRNPRKRKKK